MLTNINNSLEFYFNNQKQLKIITSDSVKNKFELLIEESLNNSTYQQLIATALNIVKKHIFSSKINRKIKSKCTKTKPKNIKQCIKKTKQTHKIKTSLKATNNKLLLTTRMSLFEL